MTDTASESMLMCKTECHLNLIPGSMSQALQDIYLYAEKNGSADKENGKNGLQCVINKFCVL